MTIKHTPGPWELSADPSSYRPFYDMPTFVSRKNSEGNRELFQSAPTAPHECDDPECPGNKNRLKLEALEELLGVSKAALLYFQQLGEVLPQSLIGTFSDREPLALASRFEAAIAKVEGKNT